ncbi:hypothetical protein HTK96_14355 [Brevundimonas vesicularis]|nr:hypothetical protein [Brevundimonas vesicularis]
MKLSLEPDPPELKRFALRRRGESGSRFKLDLDSRLQRNREAIPHQPIKVWRHGSGLSLAVSRRNADE